MRFLGLLLSAVVVELRAIFGVLPLLRRPFWIAWGLCFLPTFSFLRLLPGMKVGGGIYVRAPRGQSQDR